MCPNDNAPMQTVQREGVEFDMCPTCRGVWLDRGELEKLMAAGLASAPPQQPQAAPYPPQAPQAPWGGHRDSDYRREGHKRYDSDRRYDDDDYKRKKRSSIFDIFD